MKKLRKGKPEMCAEYDFSKGERGKYAARYASGTNIVIVRSGRKTKPGDDK